MKKILFATLCAAMTLVGCGGNAPKSEIRMGDLSEFDSLSYAMGANYALGISAQMSHIPFDTEVLDKALKKALLGKEMMSRTEADKLLREYFSYEKAGKRSQEIALKRAQADSLRWANGDSTEVEYGPAPEMFENDKECKEISEAFGTDIGCALRNFDLPLQVSWVLQAMEDVRSDASKMERDEVITYLDYYFRDVMPKRNAEASEAWLEKIAGKRGVEKTESGLLYRIDKAGDPYLKPEPRDMVKVHYTGRLRSGRVFDSSIFENRPKEQQEMLKQYYPDTYNENNPAEFQLNQVIQGWTEGMQLVGKGGKITLWIPSELAYGARGTQNIAPNEALEFEVELIDVTRYVPPVIGADPEDTTVEDAE